MNIGTEAELKFAKIGDYCDNATMDKVIKFLLKYQYFFPTKFSDLKCIIGDLGVMKIMLKPDVKPVKQRPYYLNHKYNNKVHLELDKMLVVWIIDRWRSLIG